ncbi:hypothetical protein AG0111_0g9953 [Alternaria gaisen]|uniref:Uncharacterized protein n=1 Tax=Alternaria gaisen TaxID=167740 RepID=A0ACB6FBQ6_9PLEO|nr:hypothetical protein AG0111_0g9953 [Alternaria gaisen]
MPYITYVPGVPQPYITNDPRIYIDCLKLLKWECELRPFHDAFCKELRADEDEQSLADRRRDQLEVFWVEALQRQTSLRDGSDRPDENTGTLIEVTVESLAAHDLGQSVLSDIKKRGEGKF